MVYIRPIAYSVTCSGVLFFSDYWTLGRVHPVIHLQGFPGRVSICVFIGVDDVSGGGCEWLVGW